MMPRLPISAANSEIRRSVMESNIDLEAGTAMTSKFCKFLGPLGEVLVFAIGFFGPDFTRFVNRQS